MTIPNQRRPKMINEGRDWLLFMRLSAAPVYVQIVLRFDSPVDAASFAFRCLCWDYVIFHRADWPGGDVLAVEEWRWLQTAAQGELYLCLN